MPLLETLSFSRLASMTVSRLWPAPRWRVASGRCRDGLAVRHLASWLEDRAASDFFTPRASLAAGRFRRASHWRHAGGARHGKRAAVATVGRARAS